jgi:hypothetical protein
MAWPFTSPSVQPNLDTGVTAVPTVEAAVDATNPIWLFGGSFNNTGAVSRLVTIKNTGGDEIAGPFDVPPSVGPVNVMFPCRPCAGLRWVASGAGIKGQLWGWK